MSYYDSKNSKFTKVISTVYCFLFFYRFFYKYFMFRPIISALRKSDTAQEIYFNNEIGGYAWNPLNNEISVYENVLFYFIDFSGNSTSRFAVIRKLQFLFPDYTVIILDYPGFGLSYMLEMNVTNIIHKVVETINCIIDGNEIKNMGFIAEKMGNYVARYVLSKKIKKNVKFYIEFNGISNVMEYQLSKYSLLALPFLLPCVVMKYPSALNTIEKTVYLSNDEKFYEKSTLQRFILDRNSIETKMVFHLEGKGLSCFLLPSNDFKLSKMLNFLFKE